MIRIVVIVGISPKLRVGVRVKFGVRVRFVLGLGWGY